MRRLDSKGLAIAQVLVMAMILAMASVMMLRWALGRHVVASRVHKQAKSRSAAQGVWARALARYDGQSNPCAPNPPPCSFTETIDGKSVTVTASGPDADGSYAVTVNVPD